MQVFLYEFFSGGGIWSLEPSLGTSAPLLREGAAMTAALAEDLSRITGVRVVIMRDTRLADWNPPGCQVLDIADAVGEWREFERLAAQSDWTVVIAPELDNQLLHRCRAVETGGGRLLGPDSDTVALASDKRATSEFLSKAGISTPLSHVFATARPGPDGFKFPAVLKPRRGAGSVGIRLIQQFDELPKSLNCSEWCLEEWCPGQAVSTSWIAAGPVVWPLEPCLQHISNDGEFRYMGGWAPLKEPLRSRARALAKRVAGCLPPTLGYLGLDAILSADGSEQDTVIEINPRLTTSYLGLRKMAQVNLAEAMLAAAAKRDFELRFSGEPIEFGTGDTILFGE